ncbi:putative pollen-specific leucine-rich repeat extensin-like protein 3 [Iris pallida]|uniref:Pollen-specific leucine-rich repeat extensin-like protein 3 n=1 Tax=Iris pallida TaxID=29817 RepID=A0AAX6FWH6_IRIPA|nr:putative pollen-specific leucine-rich repeat extensin-like protein 3 [Iris pallida]
MSESILFHNFTNYKQCPSNLCPRVCVIAAADRISPASASALPHLQHPPIHLPSKHQPPPRPFPHSASNPLDFPRFSSNHPSDAAPPSNTPSSTQPKSREEEKKPKP